MRHPCSLIVALLFLLPLARPDAAVQRRDATTAGVCEREGLRFVGRKLVALRPRQSHPRKLRDVKPSYPQLPPGTIGRGIWIGEVLLGTDGKVAHVWPIRRPRFTPPFPAFDQAVVDAIRQWEYEPMATPVCLTVSVTIDWE